MSYNQPYDPYPPTSTDQHTGGGKSRTEALQDDIDEVNRTMQSNLRATAQRGEGLNDLQNKTEQLGVNAQGFRRGANRVRKQMWLKDMKMRICLIVGIIILLVVIIVPSVIYARK